MRRPILTISTFQVLSDGDPVQFEAVPQDSQDNPYYCSWFASLVWKGKRPPFEDPNLATGNTLSVVGRRGSIGSTGSSESISTDGSSESLASLPTSTPVENVERGVGVIAKILDEACGLIWWPIRPNHFQSVWFDRKHTFLYGMNLAQHDLGETFRQGEVFTKDICKTPNVLTIDIFQATLSISSVSGQMTPLPLAGWRARCW